MDPISRALWFINSHFGDDIALEDATEVAGVSRHHLAQVFGRVVGRSVMGYARGLRLSAAARKLADGAPDILAVALDAGYGSHEAFSRAFRETFGTTPEEVRAQRSTTNLALTEPMTMDKFHTVTLKPRRYVDGKAMLVAGLKQTLTFEGMAAIPAQWQQFMPHIGHVPGEIADAADGVCFNLTDSGMDDLTGVAVNEGTSTPKDLATIRIPAARYAVFRHDEHISRIGDSWGAVWGGGLEATGHKAASSPYLEHY
jgi:AraC family transcriptional regulator